MNATQLVINSRDRDFSTDSSDAFKIQLSQSIKASKVSLKSADIPNTAYNVTSSNNVIYFNDGTNRTAVVTPGNYTATTLKAAVDSAFAVSGTALTITYNYSASTYKVTISATGAITLTFGTNQTASMASLLGYPPADTTSATSHIASNVIQLTSDPWMLSFSFASNNTFTTRDAFCSFIVPVNAEGGYTVQFRESDDFKQKTNSNDKFIIQSFSVRLQKYDGSRLDLNGGEWSCVLQID
jgi:hypothetical protein